MHGTLQMTPQAATQADTLVIDPVCRMRIDPATAAAHEIYNGKTVYFCAEGCRHQFLANPAAYAATIAGPHAPDGGHDCCAETGGHDLRRLSPRVLGVAGGAGVLASALILGFYFAALSLVSGWPFTVEQFAEWWPYIVTLAAGFGVQVGLFVYLRRAVHGAASGKVMAASGTTSGIAMVSCCTHYLVNLLPVLGATGLVTFIGTYQVELFWFGIASNLAGIAYMGRRLYSFAQGA